MHEWPTFSMVQGAFENPISHNQTEINVGEFIKHKMSKSFNCLRAEP
jgi:hypothetical protein